MRLLLSALAFLGLVFAAQFSRAAPATAVDPSVVGAWQTMVGNSDWYWDIHADGTYAFHAEGGAPAPAHSGIVTFNGGHWSLAATQGLATWRDGGSYEMGNANQLVATGVLGTGLWHRVSVANPPPPKAPDAAQKVSADMATLAAQATMRARMGKPDAVLTEITASGNDLRDLEFEFFSATAPLTIVGRSNRVTIKGTGATATALASSVTTQPNGRIPDRFVDLPVALAEARRAGMMGPVQQAQLSVLTIADARFLAWQFEIADAGRVFEYYVDGFTGEFLDKSEKSRIGPRTDWTEPTKMYRIFAEGVLPRVATPPAALRPPATGPNCGIIAACRAQAALDPEAQQRIDGGYATTDDIAKYDK